MGKHEIKRLSAKRDRLALQADKANAKDLKMRISSQLKVFANAPNRASLQAFARNTLAKAQTKYANAIRRGSAKLADTGKQHAIEAETKAAVKPARRVSKAPVLYGVRP